MNIRRTLIAVVGAAIMLGALASAASARNLEVSNQRLRAVFSRVEFHLPGATSVCAATIEGSFHSRTAAKVAGSLVGYVTRVELGACTNGTASILTSTLPWHARFSAFVGTLPEITSIIGHIIGAAARVREAEGIACLLRSSTTEPVILNFHRETVTRVITGVEIRGTVRTGIECLGIAGSFRSDRGPVVGSPNGERVTLNLI